MAERSAEVLGIPVPAAKLEPDAISAAQDTVIGMANAAPAVSVGLLYAEFYILTALAAIVYYRRRIVASPLDAVTVGVLPLAAAGFLVWLLARLVQAAPAPQLWSLGGILAAGLVVMLVARFGLRSAFFAIARESDSARY